MTEPLKSASTEILLEKINLFFPVKLRPEYSAIVAALAAEIERLKFLNQEERQTIDDLSRLCTRAADAMECHNLDHLQDDLIVELRKAAE